MASPRPRAGRVRPEKFLTRPAAPRGDRKHQREEAKSELGLCEPSMYQYRHHGAGSGNTETDTSKDRAAREPASGRWNLREHERSGQCHQHTACHPCSEAPNKIPPKRERKGASKKRGCGYSHHYAQGRNGTQSRSHSRRKHGARKIPGKVGGPEVHRR